MRVEWSPSAIEQLDAIEAYLRRFSEAAARRTIERITSRVGDLVLFSRLGRIVPELEFEQIRELIEGPYRILYHIRPDTIEILGVFHGALDALREHDDD